MNWREMWEIKWRYEELTLDIFEAKTQKSNYLPPFCCSVLYMNMQKVSFTIGLVVPSSNFSIQKKPFFISCCPLPPAEEQWRSSTEDRQIAGSYLYPWPTSVLSFCLHGEAAKEVRLPKKAKVTHRVNATWCHTDMEGLNVGRWSGAATLLYTS